MGSDDRWSRHGGTPVLRLGSASAGKSGGFGLNCRSHENSRSWSVGGLADNALLHASELSRFWCWATQDCLTDNFQNCR